MKIHDCAGGIHSSQFLGLDVGIECFDCSGSKPPCDADNYGEEYYCSGTDYCEVVYAGNFNRSELFLHDILMLLIHRSIQIMANVS